VLAGHCCQRLRTLGHLLCFAAATTAWAQDEALSERQFFEELPVVLSVSRLPTPLHEAPGAVTVLDQRLIRATGYRDITRLLRLVPGFNVASDRGHTPYVAYHGLNDDAPNMMQVLVDGRSVYSPAFVGGVDWTGLPLTIDEIDRIEVVRGSNSAAYGSNAFLGVVNIITKHSAQDQGFLANYVAGENGLHDGLLRYGGRIGDLTLRLSAEGIRDGGFDKLFDDSSRRIVTMRADYALTPRDEISFSAGQNQGTRFFGFPNSPNNENGVRPAYTKSNFAHLRWRRTLSPTSEFSAGYYHNRDHWDESQTSSFDLTFLGIPGLSVVPVEVDAQRTSYRDNVDFQHIFSPTSNTRLVWGAEARRDVAKSHTFLFGRGAASSQLARGFANLEWRVIRNVIVNAGGMLEKYAGKEERFAPRLFVNWTVVPGQTLRAGITRAYREPSIGEEKIDARLMVGPLVVQTFTGRGELAPEKITAAEVGWFGTFPAFDATIDVRLFDERVNNLIDTVRLPDDSQQFVNVDSPVSVVGGEYQLKFRPWRDGDVLISHALFKINNTPDPSFERSAPGYTASITWLQRWPAGWSSTLTYFTLGPYSWLGGGTPLPSSQYWDARLAYTFRVMRTPIEVAVGALNLGRKRSEFRLNALYTPADVIGTTAFASVRLGL
jgi:iron complex outermembrane recepter protein